MKKRILVIAAVLTGLALFGAVAQDASSENQAPVAQTAQVAENTAEAAPAEAAKDSSAIKYIAAGLAVGLACIAGGMAVGKIGAAAMGAMSENAELSGKALPFVGLAEGICLWGFLVALLIIIL
ncbi:MAG: ATPase [Treponema sp.]|uniref:ATP synthase subunit C n=1 Tax=Treponema sp. TaxID=166 RepID=UPI001B7B7E50|nr:ATP synthase subunit C [Treponema sp.]MBP3771491.1 ATPase [Treponema sp.]MBQ9282322.1 ATPase [Treponema sp.]